MQSRHNIPVLRDIVSQFLDLGPVGTSSALEEGTESTVSGNRGARASTGDMLSIVVPAVGVNAVDCLGKLNSYLVVTKGVAVG